jgi:uncharacterized Zn-binding protein involved in type VI secretion
MATEDIRVAMDTIERIGDNPSHDGSRVRLARRMTANGLPGLARQVVNPALARADEGALIAEAEAAIDLGELNLAESILSALPQHPETPELLALAASARGDFAAAAAALAADTSDTEHGQDIGAHAWRSGDWAGAAETGDPGRQALAAYMRGADAPPQETMDALSTAAPDRMTAYESLFEPLDDQKPASLKEARSLLERVDAELELLKELRGDG